MRTRFKLALHVRRGEHTHSYTLYEGLRPGKAQRVLGEETTHLLRHETRSGLLRGTLREFETGATLRLEGGHCTFALRLTRKEAT